MKRLFIGIPVSEEVKEKIKPVVKALQETGNSFNFVSLNNLHLTLKFLGEVEEKKIPEIMEIIGKVARKQASFEISLQDMGTFPNKRMIKVIWIGIISEALIKLMKELEKELQGIRRNEYSEEVPHLTIARVKMVKDRKKLQEILKEYENTVFGSMLVNQLFLYESTLTPKGPTYKIIQEFELV